MTRVLQAVAALDVLAGAFVVSCGRVVAQFVHESAADRPDSVDLTEKGVDCAVFEGELEHDGFGVGFRDQLREMLETEGARRV